MRRIFSARWEYFVAGLDWALDLTLEVRLSWTSEDRLRGWEGQSTSEPVKEVYLFVLKEKNCLRLFSYNTQACVNLIRLKFLLLKFTPNFC